jgi:large subunit ribosomal protein L24
MAKSMRIKTDDQVIVTSGKDAGKTGRVVRTDPQKRRVYVEGMTKAQAGGIVEKEGPIHASNVMLLDPKSNKGTRVGVRRDNGGKRVRYAKSSGAAID